MDQEEGAKESVIVAGEPDESELVARILSDDPDMLMPPPVSGKSLTEEEKILLRRWVAEGAEYQPHWSFIPPQRPAEPEVAGQYWVTNPIDTFVLKRLETASLIPSPAADKATLLRRVTLDLTGLPPTPQELQDFENDRSPKAYGKVVDRLLKLDRYGERMAAVWLDASRYADTNGYQYDGTRSMWMWRDWVIDAYNTNMPFDQFTVEQIAGDMLSSATLQQRIATGFNRNHRINTEGGLIPEEYRVEYVMDRLDTTSTVFLGLTVGCARCHAHKFDPISHREFYQLFSYFNNVPENGRGEKEGNSVPIVTIPIEEKQQTLRHGEAEVTKIREKLNSSSVAFLLERDDWIKQTRDDLAANALEAMWRVPNVVDAAATSRIELVLQADGSLLATGANPAKSDYTITLQPGAGKVTGLRLKALTHPTMTQKGLSRSVNGNFVLTDVRVFSKRPDQNTRQSVKLKQAEASYSQTRYPISNAVDDNPTSGWAILGRKRVAAGIEDTTAVFHFEKPTTLDDDTELIVELKHQSSFRAHTVGCFRLSITSAPFPALDGQGDLPIDVVVALQTEDDSRSPRQEQAIDKHFRSISKTLAAVREELAAAEERLVDLRQRAMTSVMVMQEMEQPRQTFLLNRGQYDQPGEEVRPGIPAALGKLPAGSPNNRLGFAQWLVDPSNPLTARVAVNRYWQMYFGTGIVKTANDFGSQGESPSHPDLLDWLATEFIESGWNVKAMQKLIVTSATYRQVSDVRNERHERDPDNRLLSRGARFRLRGMFVRDQALAASGLLNETLGGPSVKPYQPDGLWKQITTRAEYVPDQGEDLFRRSLYTFWKRTVAPPSMIIFDESGREACNVLRRATNSPLHSLVTLNDTQYVEAARFLAERMMTEGGDSPRDRLAYGWQLMLTRKPDRVELKRLLAGYEHYLSQFLQSPETADELLAIGTQKRNELLSKAEHAAYTMTASVIMNLDEAFTKH